MSVVISHAETNLSTVNGFNRVEAHNLYFIGIGSLALTSYRAQNVTFANAGNCLGIGLGIYLSGSGNDRKIDIALQETKGAATISIASPAVVTLNSHGFSDGQKIVFSTTGALPTGLAVNATYFVKYINANTFNLSATLGGANINTSGSQSGVHTLWATRIEQIYDNAYMVPENYLYYTIPIVPFVFATPYAVDTAANKWRFFMYQTLGTIGTLNVLTSDSGTNISFFAWCDNAVSFTDEDVLICKERVTIDKSATIKGVLGTGNTVYSTAAIVCRSLDLTADGISKLVWQNPPLASYEFKIDGTIQLPSYSGFQIGSAASPIPASAPAKITFKIPSVGTDYSGIRTMLGTSTARSIGQNSFLMYGEIPTSRIATLASDAAISQNKINTTVDMSADWKATDRIVIGKNESKGQGDNTVYVISSISGTEITLTGNIAVKRYAGGKVINLSRQYGIELKHEQINARAAYIRGEQTIWCKISGAYFRDVGMIAGYYATYAGWWSPSSAKIEINDNIYEATFNASGYTHFASISVIPALGAEVKRNYCFRGPVIYTVGAAYQTLFKSGTLTVEDNVTLNPWADYAGIGGTTNAKVVWNRNVWNNGYGSVYPLVLMTGRAPVFSNNEVWGNGVGSGVGDAAIAFGTFCQDPVFSGNTFDNNDCAIGFSTLAFLRGGKSRGDTFGATRANTTDIRFQGGIYGEMIFTSPLSLIVNSDTYLTETVNGTRIGIVNENNVAKVDRMLLTEGYFTRCGDGLADTTVHTSGSGKFCLRFEPLDSMVPLVWEQTYPTGDIQGKTAAVVVWVKINNAAYYAGTNIMPTLVIEYDDGTIIEKEATETTDWQNISLSFAPTTDFGRIKISIKGATDATGSNARFYVDDMTVFMPPASNIALGGLDLWADALPITPSLSTNVNAADVWNIAADALVASGSIGERMNGFRKLGLNKITRSGNIITVYEDDGVTIWKQFDLSDKGRVEV